MERRRIQRVIAWMNSNKVVHHQNIEAFWVTESNQQDFLSVAIEILLGNISKTNLILTESMQELDC